MRPVLIGVVEVVTALEGVKGRNKPIVTGRASCRGRQATLVAVRRPCAGSNIVEATALELVAAVNKTRGARRRHRGQRGQMPRPGQNVDALAGSQ